MSKEILFLETYFVDVGQGNCTIVKAYTNSTDYYCWMIDAGSNKYPDHIRAKTAKYAELGEKIAKIIGSPKIFKVILSHPDSDHTNLVKIVCEKVSKIHFTTGSIDVFHGALYGKENFKSVLSKVKSDDNEEEATEDVFIDDDSVSKSEITEIVESGITFKPVIKGCSWDWNGTYIEPTAFNRGSIWTLVSGDFKKKQTNENSLIVVIDYPGLKGNRRMVFPGDATKKTWDSIKNLTSFGPVFLYQISHHGASDCTYPELLEILNPELIFISSHVESQHDHPHPSAIDCAFRSLITNKKLEQQAQFWHTIPFTRMQYLHELANNVPATWNHIMPLAMARTTDNKRYKNVYATNLGLYSTTAGFTYCVTLSSKVEKYKVDWFVQNDIKDEYERNYYMQQIGADLNVFAGYIFKNPQQYFPRDTQYKIKTKWTGFCFLNDKNFGHFFLPNNKDYFSDIQFLDLRLCKDLGETEILNCLLYLDNLVTILLPTEIRTKYQTTGIGKMLLQQYMLDKTSTDTRFKKDEVLYINKDDIPKGWGKRIPNWMSKIKKRIDPNTNKVLEDNPGENLQEIISKKTKKGKGKNML